MKKFAWHVLVTLVATLLLVVAPTTRVAYAEEITDAPVILLSAQTSGREVTVDAVLKKNSGILGLTVEISYDAEVMTLTNVKRGEALSSLEYLTTNVHTDKGYSITPFRINWSGKDNDTSTGTAFTMYFTVKVDAPDGNYPVTLKVDNNKAVSYLNGDKEDAKNILIGGITITIKGDGIEAVSAGEEIGPTEEKKPNIPLIVGLSVPGGILFLTGSSFATVTIIKKKGKKKSWKKVK